MFCIDPTHRAPWPTSQCLVGMLYIFVGSEEAPVEQGGGSDCWWRDFFSFSQGCVFTCVCSLSGGCTSVCMYV